MCENNLYISVNTFCQGVDDSKIDGAIHMDVLIDLPIGSEVGLMTGDTFR